MKAVGVGRGNLVQVNNQRGERNAFGAGEDSKVFGACKIRSAVGGEGIVAENGGVGFLVEQRTDIFTATGVSADFGGLNMVFLKEVFGGLAFFIGISLSDV